MLFALLPLAAAFTANGGLRIGVPRAAVARMSADETAKLATTTATDGPVARSGSIVVTDGSGSFYGSRTVFQQLYDFGNFAAITALSEDTADAKKMLISRNARYSGLLDVLAFSEGAPSTAFTGADAWLAIGPDESALSEQISAAAAAGVGRVFLLLSEMPTAADALEAQLSASGMAYTIMRTGELVDAPEGSGLKLDELDMALCEDVPKTDVFRFVTEALTLPEAEGRAFSLCPSLGVASTLKTMRLCGYGRRDEVQLLLQGVVKEQQEAASRSPEEAAEEAELVMRSEAEVAAEREEELRMLLARARQKGVENQERMAFEEKEKAAKREEMAQYYSTPDEPGSDDADDGKSPVDVPDAPPAA